MPALLPTLFVVLAGITAVDGGTQDFGCVTVLVRIPSKNKGTQRWVIERSATQQDDGVDAAGGGRRLWGAVEAAAAASSSWCQTNW